MMKKWEEIVKEKVEEPVGNLPDSVFEEFHARLEAGRGAMGGRRAGRQPGREAPPAALGPGPRRRGRSGRRPAPPAAFGPTGRRPGGPAERSSCR